MLPLGIRSEQVLDDGGNCFYTDIYTARWMLNKPPNLLRLHAACGWFDQRMGHALLVDQDVRKTRAIRKVSVLHRLFEARHYRAIRKPGAICTVGADAVFDQGCRKSLTYLKTQ
jgi:hypothetical protein